jgi:putative intracellular protease/amidase
LGLLFVIKIATTCIVLPTYGTAVDLTKIVPFLVEDISKKHYEKYNKLGDWQAHVVTDGLLITGQSPASSEPAVKALLAELE